MPVTRKIDQSRTMLDAAESGNRAAQTAHDSRQNRQQRNLDRAEGGRQFDEQMDQRELDRWDRQWQQRRADTAGRDQERAQTQAGKRRTTNFGNEGQAVYDPADDPNTAANQENKRRWEAEFGEKQRQFDVSSGIAAADKGVEQVGGAAGGIAGGNPGPDNPRLAAIQAENAAGAARGQAQMDRGIEQDTQGKGFVKTEARVEQEKQKASIPMENAKTSRMNAILRGRELTKRYELESVKLHAATTATAKKEAKVAQDETAKQLFQPIEAMYGSLDRMRQEKAHGDDWAKMQDLVKDDPSVGNLAETMDEIKEKTLGPNLGRFLNERLGAAGLKYTGQTGRMPDGTKVPYHTKGMQLLVQNMPAAKRQLMTGANKVMFGGMPEDQFNALVNKMAAKFAMKGQNLEQVIRDAGVTGDDVKNQSQGGGDQAQQYQYPESPQTGKPTKRITPAGAAAKGGTDFTNEPYPTAKPPKQPPRGPYVDLPGRMPLAGVQ